MEILKRITTYLDGSMTKEEQKSFEMQMKNDPDLASEVNFHREVDQAITEDHISEFRVFMRDFLKRSHKKTNRGNMNVQLIRKLPIAATIMVLLGISIYQLIFKQNPQNLYGKYYTPYITDLATRSAESVNNGVQISYLLYQEGDYATSSEILKNYLTDNFDDMTAHYYFGLNAMELGLSDLAIDELTLVEQDISTPFKLHAKWYLALLYIDLEDYSKAAPYLKELSNSDNMYAKKARKLKRAVKI